MGVESIDIGQKGTHRGRNSGTHVLGRKTVEMPVGKITYVPKSRRKPAKSGLLILRHSLIDRFDAISHGKLVNNFLARFLKVDLPCFVTFARCWQTNLSVSLFRQIVEGVLQRRAEV